MDRDGHQIAVFHTPLCGLQAMFLDEKTQLEERHTFGVQLENLNLQIRELRQKYAGHAWFALSCEVRARLVCLNDWSLHASTFLLGF